MARNKAAVLSRHSLSWGRDGYGNTWDYSIILKYSGASATLAFDEVADGEPGWDFVTVEADSLGLSESRVNYVVNPNAGPAAYRTVLLATSGNDPGSHVGPIS